ncbi:MAG: serine hydrolase domain-containing protein [Planctomycetota bacterium]
MSIRMQPKGSNAWRGMVSACLAGVFPTAVDASGLPSFDDISDPLDAYLATRGDLDGAGLLLMDFEGRVLHERYWGTHDRATVVPIASATKWMSGAVIAGLVADGSLALDTRVGDVLPEFNLIDDGRADMTVSQMFSHTAGTGGQSFQIGRTDIPLSTAVSNLAAAPNLMRFEPGGTFAYGGVSMHIAGGMAEAVTETGWAALTDERLLQPLGITDTDYTGVGNELNPRVAGGMRSSIESYRRFLLAMGNDGVHENRQVIDPAAIEAMLTDYTGFGTDDAVAIDFLPNSVDLFLGHGLGPWIGRRDAAGEPTEWFSAGAFGTVGWLDLEHGHLGVFLVDDTLSRFFDLIAAVRSDAAVRVAAGLAALPGDFDGDGRVAQGDLNRVLNGWGTAPDWELTAATARPTGVIDQDELNAVLNHWGDTTPPSFSHAAVPEPGGLALGFLLGLGLSRLPRYRGRVVG